MHPFLPLLTKVCVALALACRYRIATFTAVLLFANNSNPVLLDCGAYWLRRVLRLLDQLAEAWFVPLWAWVAAGASAYIGHTAPDDVPYDAPFLDRTCADIVTSHQELLAYYQTRAPRPPLRRLCPNGDHGTREETLIILREHGRKIMGAVIMAVFCSALCSYVAQTTSSLLSPPAPASVAKPAAPTKDDLQAEFAAIFDAPRPYYHLPPADTDSIVLYRDDLPLPPFMIDLDMSVADARRAMRASQAACLHKAAEAYTAAVRRRILQENKDADNGFTGGIHPNADRDAEAAIGMELFGLVDRGPRMLPAAVSQPARHAAGGKS